MQTLPEVLLKLLRMIDDWKKRDRWFLKISFIKEWNIKKRTAALDCLNLYCSLVCSKIILTIIVKTVPVKQLENVLRNLGLR